jgi:hypothetical protein
MAGTSLSCLVPKTWPKAFVPSPVFKNKSTGSEACLDMCDFLSPWSGPHFPVLGPGFVRKDLPTQAFLKKRPPAPGLVWTKQNFLAHGRDLTFLSCAQDLAESICPHTRFQKQRSRCRSSLGHERFSQPMVRTSLSSLVSMVCAKRFTHTNIFGRNEHRRLSLAGHVKKS